MKASLIISGISFWSSLSFDLLAYWQPNVDYSAPILIEIGLYSALGTIFKLQLQENVIKLQTGFQYDGIEMEGMICGEDNHCITLLPIMYIITM